MVWIYTETCMGSVFLYRILNPAGSISTGHLDGFSTAVRNYPEELFKDIFTKAIMSPDHFSGSVVHNCRQISMPFAIAPLVDPNGHKITEFLFRIFFLSFLNAEMIEPTVRQLILICSQTSFFD